MRHRKTQAAMQHYRSIDKVDLDGVWMTIGSFDGVHLGHQAIVNKLVSGAHQAGALAVVLTFFPHPAVVLGKRAEAFYLTTPDERADLLGSLGVDVIITHTFTLEVSRLSAREFMEYLHRHLGLKKLIVGPDFALGHGREGTTARLAELAVKFDYSLEVLNPVTNGEAVVSSSLIRTRLMEGSVEQVRKLLGRPYRLSGKVVPGDSRGKSIGIPTANLEVWSERIIPKAGVYACRAHFGGNSWGAVTNVGVRPTFETQSVPLRVEAHLLDYDGDLYGKEIQLDFLAHLRDEQRFPNIKALVDQIHNDIASARKIL